MRIVHVLEVIDVEEQQRNRGAGARARESSGSASSLNVPGCRRRQRVRRGELVRLRSGALLVHQQDAKDEAIVTP